MNDIGLKEILAVAAVGAVLTVVTDKVPQLAARPVATGALLYLAGYYIAVTQRPAGGFPALTG